MKARRGAKQPATAQPAPLPTWIARKRDGGELEPSVVRRIVAGAADGSIPDYQLSALLMAIVWRGLSGRELQVWLDAMVASGDRIDLHAIAGRKVDKHSSGGVGDKVSLCLAPLVAACGVPVPMMAGRGLGHTGGTIDKLESIRGFRTDLEPTEFRRVLQKAGLVIAGQSARLVPADRALYALRDATGTVESIPLIASSILSKKLAEGAEALVMDVKVGSGAFLSEPAQARELARTLVDLGRRGGLQVVALLTAMDEPLGREVGNACEVREAIDVLRGTGPADTRTLTVRLGAEMLVLGRVAKSLPEGVARIEAAIASGAGLEQLVRCIEAQGGDARVVDDPSRLPTARAKHMLGAARAGFVAAVDAAAVGRAAVALGAGRQRKDEAVDHAVGITVHHKVGDAVQRGEPLLTIAYNDDARLQAAEVLLSPAVRITATRPPRHALVRSRLE